MTFLLKHLCETLKVTTPESVSTGNRRLTMNERNSVTAEPNKSAKYNRRNTTHGFSAKSSPYYKMWRAWYAMRRRCYDFKDQHYMDYGGRGITVCDRWKGSFENFINDMGFAPEKGTLDRIDNDKGYAPENCRWVTMAIQRRNCRSNRWIEYKGERMVVRDWEKKLGAKIGVIYKRLELGWSDEEAVSIPIRFRSCWKRPKKNGTIHEVNT